MELLPLHLRLAGAKYTRTQTSDSQACTSSPRLSSSSNEELPCLSQVPLHPSQKSPDNARYSDQFKNKNVPLSSEEWVEQFQEFSTTPNRDNQTNTEDKMEILLTDSPVTPLPNYATMFTPELKQALKKFGVKALPKRKAVAILKHIYDETHPWVELENSEHPAPQSCSTDASGSSSVEFKASSKKRKLHVGEAVGKNCKPQGKKVKTANSQKHTKATASQKNAEISFSSSMGSSKSDPEDLPEELADSSETEISASQSTMCTKDVFYNVIHSNNSLYAKILMYEPLQLSDLYQELKNQHIKISKKQLMDFLDEECITFTIPRSEKQRTKQQSRNQRFRKRKIAQLSQPTAQ